MKTLLSYIDYMNELADALIQVATQLRDMSQIAVSEEELQALQNRQEEVLIALETADQELHQNYSHQFDEKVLDQIDQKLLEFQNLNHEYLKNIQATHGLIEFDLQQHKEGRHRKKE